MLMKWTDNLTQKKSLYSWKLAWYTRISKFWVGKNFGRITQKLMREAMRWRMQYFLIKLGVNGQVLQQIWHSICLEFWKYLHEWRQCNWARSFYSELFLRLLFFHPYKIFNGPSFLIRFMAPLFRILFLLIYSRAYSNHALKSNFVLTFCFFEIGLHLALFAWRPIRDHRRCRTLQRPPLFPHQRIHV